MSSTAPCIALLTDFGLADPYAAEMKAVIIWKIASTAAAVLGAGPGTAVFLQVTGKAVF
ncbi:MAG: SAM-dependent chlorinase/fluorinase [Candidatus Omnitrophica bacterium]|nr:SAM-dependent chlorinase/fluorinase [Candidatus Omnitrophota bacterium]